MTRVPAPGRRWATPATAALLAICLTGSLTGCGQAATTSTSTGAPASATATGTPTPAVQPSPAASVATQCVSVMAALPDTVAGLAKGARTTLTAQWGNPAITLRCGVPKPTALTQDAQCNEVDGVGWFAEQQGGGYRFTTIGRAGYVEVTVPASAQPAADALVDLAPAVKKMRLVTPCV